MAPKKNAAAATASITPPTTIPSSTPVKIPSKSSSQNQSPQQVAIGIWQSYLDKTPQRTKLIDPFNAFLSGFSATVGQFVLTASLRIQTNAENKAEFNSVSPERAFADYVFGSLILHFFCVNFIN
ncbi:oligosaccharyltransferase complex subunit epsilon [Ciborinia camelliae]|nr:oligosaccharyltransferase complex subunit epsilon [Ciborinia camelliae]